MRLVVVLGIILLSILVLLFTLVLVNAVSRTFWSASTTASLQSNEDYFVDYLILSTDGQHQHPDFPLSIETTSDIAKIEKLIVGSEHIKLKPTGSTILVDVGNHYYTGTYMVVEDGNILYMQHPVAGERFRILNGLFAGTTHTIKSPAAYQPR